MSCRALSRLFPLRSPLPPPLVPDIKLVCAWCDAVIREGVEPESHGICPPCAAKVREDHEREDA